MNRDGKPPNILIKQTSRVDELRIFWEEKSPGSAGSGTGSANATARSATKSPFQFPTDGESIFEQTDKTSVDDKNDAAIVNTSNSEVKARPETCGRAMWKSTKNVQHSRSQKDAYSLTQVTSTIQKTSCNGQQNTSAFTRNIRLRSTIHGTPNARGFHQYEEEGFFAKKAPKQSANVASPVSNTFERNKKSRTASLKRSFRRKFSRDKFGEEKEKFSGTKKNVEKQTTLPDLPTNLNCGQKRTDYLQTDNVKERRRSHSFSDADKLNMMMVHRDITKERKGSLTMTADDTYLLNRRQSDFTIQPPKKKTLKLLKNGSDLFRRLSPDRRKSSPKVSTENLSDAVGVRLATGGSSSSLTTNVTAESPFKRSYAKSANSTPTHEPTSTVTASGRNFVRRNAIEIHKADLSDMDDKTDGKHFSPKKFSSRMSLRKKFKKQESKTMTDSKALLNGENPNTCNGCGFSVNTNLEHVSVKGLHYHRTCFKCKKCDQALTLKTSRRDTEGGVACEPCTQNEAMTEGKQSHDSFKADDLFAMLEKVQGTRLDEQRCSLHMPAVPVEKQVEAPLYPSIQEVLRKGLPYPQVIPPPHGGYWAQGFHPDSPHLDMDVAKEPMLPYTDKLTTEREEIITSYRRHFLGKEHVNLFAYDDHLGPLVMSVKHEDSAIAESGYTRILLRCRSRSWIHRIPSADGGNPVSWAKNISQDITVDRFYPVVSTAAWNSILQFDEHSVNSANKFGILYQKPNQAKEEEVFGNQEESPAFKEFLEFIGEIVDLQGFKGFRGGLDVQHGHTGDTSVYGKYADKEVMFHVSTMLPYIEGDRQQLQRKRHIGNDIVAIVFQDGETPFVPNMITSHFLHAYIIIQAIDPCTPECRYKVSVTCREDVPEFEPSLPEPAIFAKDDTFREWLYCKMMNAEWACYKSEQFAKLQYRTRSMLLDQLYDEIQNSTESMLGMKTSVSTDNLSSASSDTVKEGSNNGFFDAFKRFTRNRAPSIEQNASPLMSNRKLGATSSESKTSISSVNNEQSKSPGGNLGRSATFDENDRQRQKGESSSLQHGNDSGNVSDLTLDYRSTQGSNPSLSGSPKKTRRNRAHSPCPSCGSYNSLDSDTGLESMASSSHTDSWPRSGKTGTFETNNNHPVDQNQNKQTSGKNYQQQQRTHITNCIDRKHSGKELDHLRNEVAKLRSEKQEWSRQQQEYMNLQKELRKLREKDLKQPNDVNNLSRKLDQIGVTDAIPTTAEHLV
ncbi:uncharacterized protein LOC120327908 isoform X2 [Styela clava]